MTTTELPSSIGRYEIVREIGRGAMGGSFELRRPCRELGLMLPAGVLRHVPRRLGSGYVFQAFIRDGARPPG